MSPTSITHIWQQDRRGIISAVSGSGSCGSTPRTRIADAREAVTMLTKVRCARWRRRARLHPFLVHLGVSLVAICLSDRENQHYAESIRLPHARYPSNGISTLQHTLISHMPRPCRRHRIVDRSHCSFPFVLLPAPDPACAGALCARALACTCCVPMAGEDRHRRLLPRVPRRPQGPPRARNT